MAELTLEQKKAIALAKAKLKLQQAAGGAGGVTPAPVAPWDQPGAGGVPGQSEQARQEIEAYKALPSDDPRKKLEDVIGTGMYRTGDPQATYERFKNDPRTEHGKLYGFFGPESLTFEGYTVPPVPETRLETKRDEAGNIVPNRVPGREIPQSYKIVESAGSGLRNIALDTAAVGDELTENVTEALGTEYNPGMTESLEGVIPKPIPAQGDWDQAERTVTELGTGLAAGRRLGMQLPISGRGMQTAKYVLGNIGSVAGMDKDTQGMLFGKDGLFNDTPPDQIYSSESEERLAKKADLLKDALITGGFFEMGGRAAAKAYDVVDKVLIEPLKPVFSKKATQKQVVGELISKLNTVNPDDPDAVEKLAKYIKENANVSKYISDAAGEHGFERTSMSALAEGAQGAGDEALAKRAMEIEQGTLEQGAYNLQVKRNEPMVAMDKMQDAAVASKGGVDTIEQAKDVIAKEGIEQTEAIKQGVSDAQFAIDEAEAEVAHALKHDPRFGELIQSMEKDANIDIDNDKTRSMGKIMTRITDGTKKLIGMKNDFFNKIPKGVKIDDESFQDALFNAQDAVKQIPELAEYLPKMDATGEILEAGADTDFWTLNNKLLPKINAAFSRARRAGDGNLAGQLAQLRDNITDTQLEFLESSGDGAIAQMARDARKFYREKFVRYTADGTPTADLIDAYYEAFEGNLKNVPFEEQPRYPTTVRQTIEGVGSKDPGGSKQVLDLLEQYGGANAGEITDVFLGDLAKEIQSKMATGSIKDLDPNMALKALGDKAAIIKERYPLEYEKILQFQNDMRTNAGKMDKLKERLNLATQVAREKEVKLNESVLSDFIESRMGTDKKFPKGSGYQVMKKLFSNENNHGKLKDLMTIAEKEGNQQVQEGMKSAFYNYIKERSVRPSGNFNATDVKKLQSELNSLSDYGDIVFGKGNPELENYKGFMAAVLNENAKRTGQSISPFAKGFLKTEAAKATNTVITLTLGVLNRMAATVRRGTGTLIERMDPADNAEKILDLFQSNPQEAHDMMMDFAARMRAEKPSDVKRSIFDLAVRSQIFGQGDGQTKFEEFGRIYDNVIGRDQALEEEQKNLK